MAVDQGFQHAGAEGRCQCIGQRRGEIPPPQHSANVRARGRETILCVIPKNLAARSWRRRSMHWWMLALADVTSPASRAAAPDHILLGSGLRRDPAGPRSHRSRRTSCCCVQGLRFLREEDLLDGHAAVLFPGVRAVLEARGVLGRPVRAVIMPALSVLLRFPASHFSVTPFFCPPVPRARLAWRQLGWDSFACPHAEREGYTGGGPIDLGRSPG